MYISVHDTDTPFYPTATPDFPIEIFQRILSNLDSLELAPLRGSLPKSILYPPLFHTLRLISSVEKRLWSENLLVSNGFLYQDSTFVFINSQENIVFDDIECITPCIRKVIIDTDECHLDHNTKTFLALLPNIGKFECRKDLFHLNFPWALQSLTSLTVLGKNSQGSIPTFEFSSNEFPSLRSLELENFTLSAVETAENLQTLKCTRTDIIETIKAVETLGSISSLTLGSKREEYMNKSHVPSIVEVSLLFLNLQDFLVKKFFPNARKLNLSNVAISGSCQLQSAAIREVTLVNTSFPPDTSFNCPNLMRLSNLTSGYNDGLKIQWDLHKRIQLIHVQACSPNSFWLTLDFLTELIIPYSAIRQEPSLEAFHNLRKFETKCNLPLSKMNFLRFCPRLESLVVRLDHGLDQYHCVNDSTGNFSFALLTHLRRLTITNGTLHRIPDLRSSSRTLEYLDLSENSIHCVENLDFLELLRYLDLSSNPIDEIQRISSLRNLQTLVLEKTNIAELDGSLLKPLKKLRRLSVATSKVSKVANICDLPLQVLCLRENSLHEVKGIHDLPQLYALDLSYNSLYSLDPLFKKFPNLGLLDLSWNKLERLTYLDDIGTLRPLQLNVSFNRMSFSIGETTISSKELLRELILKNDTSMASRLNKASYLTILRT